MSKRNPWKVGLTWMAFGTMGVFVLVLVMNLKQTIRKDRFQETATKIAKVKPEEKKQKPQPMQRRKPKQNLDLDVPRVDSVLTGSSFGLPQFEFDLGENDSFLKNLSNTTMTADSVDKPPKVKFRPKLQYPPSAYKEGTEGYVVLSLLIGVTGAVEKAKTLDSHPEGVFELAALEAVKQWKFQAAEYNGGKVATWQRQKIVFQLN